MCQENIDSFIKKRQRQGAQIRMHAAPMACGALLQDEMQCRIRFFKKLSFVFIENVIR
jgi:hypothetical protein